jgi:hypothetical protein
MPVSQIHCMSIDWFKLIAAILVLLPPIALFHGRKVRYRSVPSGFESYWSRTFALGLHTVDLCRALLGAWLLVEALSFDPEVPGSARMMVASIQAVVLLVAMLLQTFVCKEIDAANPPFAFAIGLVLGFLPPLVAGFALFVAIMAGFGLRSVGAFFPLLAMSVAGAGVLFSQFKVSLPSLAALAGATMSPWLFTLLFPRHFVIAYAAKKTETHIESPEK